MSDHLVQEQQGAYRQHNVQRHLQVSTGAHEDDAEMYAMRPSDCGH
jgi:hypothetical protein